MDNGDGDDGAVGMRVMMILMMMMTMMKAREIKWVCLVHYGHHYESVNHLLQMSAKKTS